jgi:hypothetical protein
MTLRSLMRAPRPAPRVSDEPLGVGRGAGHVMSTSTRKSCVCVRRCTRSRGRVNTLEVHTEGMRKTLDRVETKVDAISTADQIAEAVARTTARGTGCN